MTLPTEAASTGLAEPASSVHHRRQRCGRRFAASAACAGASVQTDTLASRDFKLGPWLVQPRLGRICRGTEELHVTPRAMSVLVYLAEADGAVVPRNQILDAVWPRMAVTPDALARCLVELRKLFRDAGVIETIPKIGVRLTLPVSVEAAKALVLESGPSPLRWPRSIGRVATTVALAILVGTVVWWSALRRTDSASSTDPDALAYYRSAVEYSERPNRLEALPYQETLFRHATEEDFEFTLAWVGLGRTHTSAYWYGLDRTPARLDLADEALRRALALDHDLPAVHLALADFYFKGRGDSAAALAELAVAELGLADAPNPELFLLRSSIHRRTGAWDLAAADGERAVEHAPNNLPYRRQLHITYVFLRNFRRAESVVDDILRLYPDDGTAYVDKAALAIQARGDASLVAAYEERAPSEHYEEGLAHGYVRWLGAIMQRDYERALRVLEAEDERIFNGDLRTTAIPRGVLEARTHRLRGAPERAAELFADAMHAASTELEVGPSRDPLATAALHLTLAEARSALGLREAALASLRAALDVSPKSVDAMFGSATQLAGIVHVLVPAGEMTGALRELDDYLGAPGHWGIDGLLADPQLEALWTDPGAAALVAKHRAAAE